MKSKRTLALEWWNSMKLGEKAKAVEEWKKNTNDDRKSWDFIIICMSSNTIQKIWEELSIIEINK